MRSEHIVIAAEELQRGFILTLLGQGRVVIEDVLFTDDYAYAYWRDGANNLREIGYPRGSDVEVVACTDGF